jgi:predicted ATP-binding protein involved in virulence
MIGTGFADHLEDTKAYAKELQKALVSSKLLPLVRKLELTGQGGVRSAAQLVESHRFEMDIGGPELKVPATWLSQGYQGTIAWIADLIGEIFWEAGGPVPTEEMEGIVLIDEIDLHLHPSWQVDLVPTLRRVFPRIQFVATTHSPMVLPGLERDEITLLRLDPEGNVEATNLEESPALMTGSEILRTFFGLADLYPRDLGAAFVRYSELVGNPLRTDAEEEEMNTLREKLRAHGLDPGWRAVPREEVGQ